MLPSELAIRDRHLREDGAMVPQRAVLLKAGVRGGTNFEGCSVEVNELSDQAEPLVVLVPYESILTEAAVLQEIDLLKVSQEFDSFVTRVDLRATEQGILGGLVGWFDLEMTSHNWLSTAPGKPATNWKQVYFLLPRDITVAKGRSYPLWMHYRPPSQDHRGMQVDVSITVGEDEKPVEQTYLMV